MLDFLFNRGGFGERAGTLGLKTIANAAKFPILPVLDDNLERLAALGREREPERDLTAYEEEDDGELRYTVAPEGPRSIHLAGLAELWLIESPEGELRWGDRRARKVALGLADGWASTLLHRLAAGPLTLDELDAAVLHLDREEVESCLKTMSRDGEVEPRAGHNGVDAYALTEWGRRGIALLIASARLEHMAGDADPIEEIDVQAAFGLALPLLRLRGGRSGSCVLTVDLGGLDEPQPTEATARFEDGRLASWSPGAGEDADARISGGVEGWFRAVIEGRFDRLAGEGDARLAGAVLEGLHEQLFALDD